MSNITIFSSKIIFDHNMNAVVVSEPDVFLVLQSIKQVSNDNIGDDPMDVTIVNDVQKY